MGTKRSVVDFILEQMTYAGTVTARRMFGEYGLYDADVFFGLVCDDQLYLKPTAGGRATLGDAVEEGSPYPGAKPHLLIRSDVLDDREWIAALVRITVAELPPPVERKPRRLAP